jgi:hypothetical protein
LDNEAIRALTRHPHPIVRNRADVLVAAMSATGSRKAKAAIIQRAAVDAGFDCPTESQIGALLQRLMRELPKAVRGYEDFTAREAEKLRRLDPENTAWLFPRGR